MMSEGLTLSLGKTVVVILTTKRGYSLPQLAIMSSHIEIKDSIRYLRVKLLRVIGFKSRVERAAAKAQTTSTALSRLMPNVRGSGQKKKKLPSTVVASKLLYASPIWAKALVYVETLLRNQRTIAIRTAMAYHMISTAAVIVIVGLIPVHLLAW